MARQPVIILLSLLLLWNMACGFVWIEVALVIPVNRASNEIGQIEGVEERLERMSEAQASYREQAFDFLCNLVIGTLAINVVALLAAIGLILSPSKGWPSATARGGDSKERVVN